MSWGPKLPLSASRPAMEKLVKVPIPEVMSTKASHQCKGELEINLPSKTSWQGHLYV